MNGFGRWRWRGGGALRRRLRREGNVRRCAAVDAGAVQPGEGLSLTENWLMAEVYPALELEERLGALKRLEADRVRGIATELEESAQNFGAMISVHKSWSEELLLDTREKAAVAWKEVVKAGKERKQFRGENLLTREARYHDVLFGVGCGVATGAVLTGVDASMFASVTRWGLVGGAMNAMALAAPTIIMGLGCGVGLRAMLHVRPWVRRIGAAAVALLGTGMAGWCWYVGTLRAVAEEAARRGEELSVLNVGVWSVMWSDPAKVFEAWQAVVLMVLQLAGGIIAAWDGYQGFDDPYPGYGRVDRAYRKALDMARGVKAAFVEAVSELTESAVFEIERRRREFDRRAKEALRIIARADGVLSDYRRRMLQVEWAVGECMREYRDVNARLRPAGTWPARFAEPVGVVGKSHDQVAFDANEAREHVRRGLRVAHAAADRAIAAVKQQRLAALAALDGVEVKGGGREEDGGVLVDPRGRDFL